MAEEHRKAVVDIFNHFVGKSFAAYPEAPPGYELYDRFLAMARGYASIVVKEEHGQVIGFAFLHPTTSPAPSRAPRRSPTSSCPSTPAGPGLADH
jgi:phosphinothricin acetyltransferase